MPSIEPRAVTKIEITVVYWQVHPVHPKAKINLKTVTSMIRVYLLLDTRHDF